jgi:hypothetical protein
VSAKALEEFVWQRLAILSKDKELMEKVTEKARATNVRELPIKRDERIRLAAEQGKAESALRNLTSVLEKEGANSARYDIVMLGIDSAKTKRTDIENKIILLENEIQELERRNIDAVVMRQHLGNFLSVFERLTPTERRELLKMLLKEVLYDGQNCHVRLSLRPLPEVWGDLPTLEGILCPARGGNAAPTGRLRRSGHVCNDRCKELPVLSGLRNWFATELPLVADTIPLHLLYENLHVSSPLKAAVRTPLATAGTSHAG